VKEVYRLNVLGDDVVFHHIGIVTKSMDEIIDPKLKIEDPIQKVRVAFADMHGLQVELIEPLGDESPVHKFLKKKQYFYHLCFSVKDVERTLEISKENDFYCVSRPAKAVAFGNNKIAWIYSREYGLIELLER